MNIFATSNKQQMNLQRVTSKERILQRVTSDSAMANEQLQRVKSNEWKVTPQQWSKYFSFCISMFKETHSNRTFSVWHD